MIFVVLAESWRDKLMLIKYVINIEKDCSIFKLYRV